MTIADIVMLTATIIIWSLLISKYSLSYFWLCLLFKNRSCRTTTCRGRRRAVCFNYGAGP